MVEKCRRLKREIRRKRDKEIGEKIRRNQNILKEFIYNGCLTVIFIFHYTVMQNH